MILSNSVDSLFSLKALVWLALLWLLPWRADAHDIAGLLQEQLGPADVREEIALRQEIRLRMSKGLPPEAPPQAKSSLSKYETFEGVLKALALWGQKSTLKVCFMNGDKDARDAVMEIFDEVIALTNLKLARAECAKETIRVSFRSIGYSSRVGTDLLLLPVTDHTMSLHDLDTKLPLVGYHRSVVMHEFMHALGFMHEHQHPDSRCEQEILWQEVKAKWKWIDDQMITNFRTFLRNNEYIVTAYDKDSLMHYQFEPELLKGNTNSSCYVQPGTWSLSEGDTQLLQRTYPK